MALHRGALFARHGGDLEALLRANPHWIVVQLQAWKALADQPLTALWTLQQSPPVPNLVEAALLQVLSWPVASGWAHVLVQALCTLAVALLLTAAARRLVPPWIATCLGLLWILSPDVLVLETTGLGQTYYENLATLGVMVCVYSFLRWCETSRLRWVVVLGSAAGLLALTRSSYGFFSLPLLALVLTRAAWLVPEQRRRSLRQAAVCAAIALSLQGGWALKNLIVFGHWTWPASTWGGASLAASIDSAGAGDELAASIEADPRRDPPWLAAFVDRHGVRPWTVDWRDDAHCPAEVRARDRRVTYRLGGENRPENTQCLRLVSEAFGDASLRFLMRRPDVLLHKLKLAYATYWFPMRYHGGQYLSLFSVDWRVERSLRPWRSLAQLVAAELPEPVYVTSGAWPDTTRRQARLLTLHLPVTLWWLAELVVLHLVTPLVVLAVLRRVVRVRSLGPRDALVTMMALTYLYSAGIHNLAELGENMRFRWSVEPVIWLLVADSLARLARLGGAAYGRAASAGPPPAGPHKTGPTSDASGRRAYRRSERGAPRWRRTVRSRSRILGPQMPATGLAGRLSEASDAAAPLRPSRACPSCR